MLLIEMPKAFRIEFLEVILGGAASGAAIAPASKLNPAECGDFESPAILATVRRWAPERP
jgi:hypothetical protein